MLEARDVEENEDPPLVEDRGAEALEDEIEDTTEDNRIQRTHVVVSASGLSQSFSAVDVTRVQIL